MAIYNTHTHLTAHCPELPGWAGTRKVKPVWILLKQVTVASAGPYASLHLTPDRQPCQHPPLRFYRPDALPAAQPTASRHWRQYYSATQICLLQQTDPRKPDSSLEVRLNCSLRSLQAGLRRTDEKLGWSRSSAFSVCTTKYFWLLTPDKSAAKVDNDQLLITDLHDCIML